VVDSLHIRWPSGLTWDTTGVASNQLLHVVEHQTSVAVPPGASLGLVLEAWPNPVQAVATFDLSVTREGPAQLEILDLQGRHVKTLVDDPRLEPGRTTRAWSLTRDDGSRVRPGVYLARLRSGGDTVWRRLVVTSR
jgi:hypothetical protein